MNDLFDDLMNVQAPDSFEHVKKKFQNPTFPGKPLGDGLLTIWFNKFSLFSKWKHNLRFTKKKVNNFLKKNPYFIICFTANMSEITKYEEHLFFRLTNLNFFYFANNRNNFPDI